MCHKQSNALHTLFHLICQQLHKVGPIILFPHFADEITEAHRSEVLPKVTRIRSEARIQSPTCFNSEPMRGDQ